jgi:DNA polymerase-3 subunit beta
MGNVVDEFPSWVKVENPKELKISSETLKNLISKTLYAVSRDDIKPALQGVFFKMEDNQMVVVSTDGAKLVKLNCENQNKTTFSGSVILPVRFLSVLKNHLMDEEITILIGDNHALVKTAEAEISTRIINQKYPDYDSVIPEDNDKNIFIDKEIILSSIKRVLIFSNRATNQISLNFKKNEVKVFTQDQENVSTGEEIIPCKYSGEEFLIGFNGEYLKETIEHQNNGDIEVTMKSHVSAAVFKTKKTDNDFNMVSLLMPIRIGE